MMGPYQEAEDGDGNTGKSNEGGSEDPLAGEAGHDLADYTHTRKDHDVDRRMGVEPEHVLEEHGIAAQLGIEDTDVEAALQGEQNQGDGQHRRAQNHDETGGIV